MDLNAVNEEWFVGQLESAESNVTELVEVLGQLAEEGRSKEADEWALMLFGKLADGDQVDQALEVL